MTVLSYTEGKGKKEYGLSILNEERRPSTQDTIDPDVVPTELAPGLKTEEEEQEEERQERLPPPPDGGLHAWLKVFGGFLVYINVWCVALFTPDPLFHQLLFGLWATTTFIST